MGSIVYETMTKLAANAYAVERHKDLYGPWLIDFHGVSLAVASDGRCILWAKDTGCLPGAIEPCPNESAKEKLLVLFDPPPDREKSSCTLGNLKAFLGKPAWEIECPECKGTSAHSDYVSCTFCEGAGVVGNEVVPGILCGVNIDRNRSACVLEPFGESEEVTIVHGKKAMPGKTGMPERVWVIGKSFRAVLVEMVKRNPNSEEPNEWKNAPSFP